MTGLITLLSEVSLSPSSHLFIFVSGRGIKWIGLMKMSEVKKKRIKWNIDLVRQAFEDGGCVLLSTEYTNGSEKLQYVCKCGETALMNLFKFNNGQRCNKCRSSRIAETLTIPYSVMLKEFEVEGYQVLTIEKDYINATQKVSFICPVGHVGEMTYVGFRSSSRCIECAGHKKLTYEQVETHFEEEGCFLLEGVYINSHTKMKYECDCGNISEINYNNFSNGKRCDICAVEKRIQTNRVPFDTVTRLFEDSGSKLLSTEYLGQNVPLSYICKCGRDGLTSYATFKRSRQCRQCSFDAMKSKLSTDDTKVDRRHLKGYKEWVKHCYKRDDYTCQCCGSNGGKLNAHHKDGYRWCAERRLDDSNSVTLCEGCHATGEYSFHRVYGNKDNTEEQYNEWMKKYQSLILHERSA